MKWSDLEAGDFVVPSDPDANLWLVLATGYAENGRRSMIYANLGTGVMELDDNEDVTFHRAVRVMRDGEDVNR